MIPLAGVFLDVTKGKCRGRTVARTGWGHFHFGVAVSFQRTLLCGRFGALIIDFNCPDIAESRLKELYCDAIKKAITEAK